MLFSPAECHTGNHAECHTGNHGEYHTRIRPMARAPIAIAYGETTVDLAHAATRIHTRGTPTGVHTVDFLIWRIRPMARAPIAIAYGETTVDLAHAATRIHTVDLVTIHDSDNTHAKNFTHP